MFVFIHSTTYFFHKNRMLLNHIQLVTGSNLRTFLYNCYLSSLSWPVLYFFQLIVASAEGHRSAFVKSIPGFTESHSNAFEFIKFILNCNCLLLSQWLVQVWCSLQFKQHTSSKLLMKIPINITSEQNCRESHSIHPCS